MKVIITGATGMVGKGVLLECIDHPEVKEILSLGRTKTQLSNPKLNETVVDDFTDFGKIAETLSGYDACFFCMGVSAGGMKADHYKTITYDYTIALATELKKLNKDMVFNYVSGVGTDSSEKGRSRWARVKGKTENDILKMGFRDAYMFRPGAIIPLRGIKSKTKAYQFMYDYFTWLIKIMKALFPKQIVNTTQIGLAMINTVLFGYDKKILDSNDILILSSKKTS